MFNFKKYPEIKKCHKKYESLSDAMYKAEARYDRSGSDKNDKLWDNAINAVDEFNQNVYSKVIFDTFSLLKPVLLDRRTNKNINWDRVFGDNFDKLSTNDKKGLVLLAEEYGALYRLPPEYYK